MSRPARESGAAAESVHEILRLIREGRVSTRREIAQVTGLARSTVSQRVDSLLERGLLLSASTSESTGGRPPTVLRFNADAGLVLAASLDTGDARVAVTNLAPSVLAESEHEISIADGPDTVLPWLAERFEELLAKVGRSASDVRAVGVGVPGPVQFATGTPVRPPIMPGWDGYPVAGWFEERFGVPTLVDNDVNVLAIGEYSREWRDENHIAVVKVSTGIGLGLIADGHVFRGAQGTAGDIGHIHVVGNSDVLCSCGNTGCLEAIAGGRAIAAKLTERGIPAHGARDVAALVREGNPDATRLLREAGREIGGVLAAVVNMVNPAVVIITGDLADAGDFLLAGVREAIYRRSTALATRSLRIARSSLGESGGVLGASVLALEHLLLSPDAADIMAVSGT